jgi:hypothetical protein
MNPMKASQSSAQNRVNAKPSSLKASLSARIASTANTA